MHGDKAANCYQLRRACLFPKHDHVEPGLVSESHNAVDLEHLYLVVLVDADLVEF